MEISLKEKRTLITGGSGGIGSAITEAFAAAGAKVCVGYHSSEEEARALVEKVEKDGGEAFAKKADVSKLEDVTALFEKLDETWGGIDVLVNCAGIDGEHALSWEIEPEDFEKIIGINLMGTFYCSQQALKRMIPQESGVVLNVSSVHEIIPWTGFAAYTAAKAGVAMLTKTMTQEAAKYGVRLLSLAPGAIRTPINKDVWDDSEKLADLKTKIPMDRIGEPEEVANIAVVLCSEVGSYMSGSSVYVDGGMIDYPSFSKGG